MSLDRDTARLARKLRQISRVELPRAHARSLNDSGAKVKTRSVRGTAIEAKLKSKTVRKRYYLKRANAKKQRVRLTVYTRDVSAISQFTPARLASIQDGKGTTRRGVTVAGRKELGAFVASGPNGARQVFRRTGRKRLPIEPIKYPIQEAAVRITRKVARRVMKREYPRILQRELRYRMQKVANAKS